jgi:hypothetical protein
LFVEAKKNFKKFYPEREFFVDFFYPVWYFSFHRTDKRPERENFQGGPGKRGRRDSPSCGSAQGERAGAKRNALERQPLPHSQPPKTFRDGPWSAVLFANVIGRVSRAGPWGGQHGEAPPAPSTLSQIQEAAMKTINRKALESAKESLGDIRVSIENILQDERDAFEAKSEKWQESDRGQRAEDAIAALEDIVNTLQDAEDNLEDLLGE